MTGAGHRHDDAGRVPARGADARPVAVPADLDDPAVVKASGRVVLPLHLQWSGPRRAYDLDDPADRARVYEIVLREGTDDDVRRFVDLGLLVEAWDDLYLPSRVRRAWAPLVKEQRGPDLPTEG